MSPLSPGQAQALNALARRHEGQGSEFVNITLALSLAELGLAQHQASGWRITAAGLACNNIFASAPRQATAGGVTRLRSPRDERE